MLVCSTGVFTMLPLLSKCLQYKMDDDGANIGILFDNRIRPHQYSRPGTAGVGSGISITQGL